MSPLIACHAAGATLALTLGVVNLVRRPHGDTVHRVVGRVWVVAMYWTIVSSFFIKELNPGRFSWIHGLSVITFVTLSIGLWAALTGRIETHRGFMRGTYLGTVGAFIGATVVPQRAVPQLAIHHPLLLSAAAAGVLLVAAMIVATARRVAQMAGQGTQMGGQGTGGQSPDGSGCRPASSSRSTRHRVARTSRRVSN